MKCFAHQNIPVYFFKESIINTISYHQYKIVREASVTILFPSYAEFAEHFQQIIKEDNHWIIEFLQGKVDLSEKHYILLNGIFNLSSKEWELKMNTYNECKERSSKANEMLERYMEEARLRSPNPDDPIFKTVAQRSSTFN